MARGIIVMISSTQQRASHSPRHSQDLASARQALQTSEADHELIRAKHQLTIHQLQQQLATLTQKLEEVQATREREAAQATHAQDVLRHQALSAQQEAKAKQVCGDVVIRVACLHRHAPGQ
jgi:uncharacterized coiled-coil protein SlyX